MRLALIASLIVPLALTACRQEPDDLDGDGASVATDCDDSDASIFPGAVELCDGVDQDCDGSVDEDADDASMFYADIDGDGFGDALSSQSACAAPEGWVADATDCDDRDAAFHPGASEEDCTDPADYNCDGSVGFADADGDGVPACEDCDDAVADVHPAATERCNGVDDDCNGEVDEAGALGEQVFYADADADSFGDGGTTALACSVPEGFVSNAEDCDDTAATAHPGGVEVCDDLDNDCDGFTDDASATDAALWYADADADGHGAPHLGLRACGAPQGFVSSSDDCDDSDATAYPSATEVCDLADNNCDGQVDEGVQSEWFADGDADGHGTSAVRVAACAAPSGFVSSADDCNDANASAFPGGSEVCDGADNNCDGQVDEGVQSEWFADGDGDGHGTGGTSLAACTAPPGFVAATGDCNDANASIFPGAPEVCDGIDSNCDTNADMDLYIPIFVDGDGDGHGSPSLELLGCEAGYGFVTSKDDCDDGDASIFPGATEVCNRADDDCDQLVDEADDSWDITSGQDSWADVDRDTFGDPATLTTTCEVARDRVLNGDDCDDTDATFNPLATDRWYDGLDHDCAGNSDYDQDGDGHDDVGYGGDDTDDADPSCWSGCTPTKHVFISSTAYDGNLGGLDGADAKCQAAASVAGLTGVYKAWLSDSLRSPSKTFTHPSAASYSLVDGTVLAVGWADLTDSTLRAPINLTEQGLAPVSTNVACWPMPAVAWSNTLANGNTWTVGSCSDWTSTAGGAGWGSTVESNGAWSAWCSGGTCSWKAYLYCVQQ